MSVVSTAPSAVVQDGFQNVELLVEGNARADAEVAPPLGAEAVHHWFRDAGRAAGARFVQAHGREDEPVDRGGEVEARDPLQHPAEDHVVGMAIAPVAARLEHGRGCHADAGQLRGAPLPERVGHEPMQHLGLVDVVGIARGHVGEVAQRDRAGAGQLGKPVRQLVVERDLVLVHQFQQQRRDVGEGHGAVAEMHRAGGGNAGHRLAERLLVDDPSVHADAHQQGPEMLADHRTPHRAFYGLVTLLGRGYGRESHGGDQGRDQGRDHTAHHDGGRQSGPVS